MFIYRGSNITSTESDVNIHIGKVWTAIDSFLTILKFDPYKIGIIPSYCHVITIVWSHHLNFNETLGEKQNVNYPRTLFVVLNKSWKQSPTKQLLYNHLCLTLQTLRIRQARHSWNCRWSKHVLISDILL